MNDAAASSDLSITTDDRQVCTGLEITLTIPLKFAGSSSAIALWINPVIITNEATRLMQAVPTIFLSSFSGSLAPACSHIAKWPTRDHTSQTTAKTPFGF